jgi:hypothetical protein
VASELGPEDSVDTAQQTGGWAWSMALRMPSRMVGFPSVESFPPTRVHYAVDRLPSGAVVARTYTYAGEAQCDRHMSVFLKAIDAAHAVDGQGFAAIKASAVANAA